MGDNGNVREELVSFGDAGVVDSRTSKEKLRDDQNAQQDLALVEIVAMIQDPNTDLAAVYKKIALQIAYLSVELSTNRRDPSTQYTLKSITDQIKALRELTHTLTESDEVAKRDVLNFDGPKFQYVLREIVDTFKRSLKEAGIDASITDNLLRIYRDKMAVKELELRRDLARFDSLPIR